LSAAHTLDFLVAKLRPPWSRAGLVPRRALVEQLLSTEAQVISVVAPPGYGKTTLLSQLQQHSPLRTAWLSLDELDNDPSVLVSYLATAFEQIEPNATPPRSWMLPGSADLGSFLRRLAVAVSSVQTPFSLVLDHVEAIESRPSADAIAELAFNLPPAPGSCSRHDANCRFRSRGCAPGAASSTWAWPTWR
jgi:LuxR family maltose regulon positive regulatory protein